MITYVPYYVYGPLLLLFVTWACMQYTGGWEDFAVLIIFSILGVAAKYLKFSRPALLMGFILSDRIESLTLQMIGLYTPEKLLDRPIFLVLIALTVAMFVYGVFINKTRLNYS